MLSDHIFTAADGSSDDREQLLKLHAERVEITRAARELGVVRATIETTTREQRVSEDLAVERVEITVGTNLATSTKRGRPSSSTRIA